MDRAFDPVPCWDYWGQLKRRVFCGYCLSASKVLYESQPGGRKSVYDLIVTYARTFRGGLGAGGKLGNVCPDSSLCRLVCRRRFLNTS
jgi:hypothetical protein